MREIGTVETRVSRRERKSALNQADLWNIDQMLWVQPDIAIHEIYEGLQLPVSEEAVRRMAVTLKYT